MKLKRTTAVVGLFAIALLVVIGLTLTSSAVGETAPDAAAGRQVFDAQKCAMCHAVSSANIEAKMKVEKMKGPDLTGVGSRYDAEWLAKYLRKEVQLDDKDHKKDFKGTDEELQAMIDWLLEQKGS